MIIHEAKASDYNSVSPLSIVDYIKEFNEAIAASIADRERLATCSKTQLKAIVAELETANKRLNYILYGRY